MGAACMNVFSVGEVLLIKFLVFHNCIIRCFSLYVNMFIINEILVDRFFIVFIFAELMPPACSVPVFLKRTCSAHRLLMAF